MSTNREQAATSGSAVAKNPDSYFPLGLTSDIAYAVIAGTITQVEADRFLSKLGGRAFTKQAEDAEIIAKIEQGVSIMLSKYSKADEDEARADSHRYFARRGFWR